MTAYTPHSLQYTQFSSIKLNEPCNNNNQESLNECFVKVLSYTLAYHALQL